MKKRIALPLLLALGVSISIGISMGYHFLIPFVLGVILSVLSTIALTQSTYFTIPRIQKSELQNEFKIRLQQSIMDISEDEAGVTAQVMVEVLDRFI